MAKAELNKQVEAQCRAVVHMLGALTEVYQSRAERFSSPSTYGGEIIGRWSAETMEILGEMLNGMDAVTDEDDWLKPIFREAQRRWPVQPRGNQ